MHSWWCHMVINLINKNQYQNHENTKINARRYHLTVGFRNR